MNLSAIVLAAGKGKRMLSDTPKVLHKLAGKPLIHHVIKSLLSAGIKDICAVVGHKKEDVISYLNENFSVKIFIQEDQLGTAHAVNCTRNYFLNKNVPIIIVNGDSPLIKASTIQRLFHFYQNNKIELLVVTTDVPNPAGYGRILRDSNNSNKILQIIEEKDLNDQQKKINEINSGIYIVKSSTLFELIDKVKINNLSNEYYLTDIVKLANENNLIVYAYKLQEFYEALGVNTREDLSIIEDIYQKQIKKKWMENGVTFILPHTTYVEDDVIIEKDVLIEPNCVIKGKTIIRSGTIVKAFSYIEDSILPENFVTTSFHSLIKFISN